MAFLPYPVIDLYIRAFVSGSQPHSGHRYFIDLRPNTPGHLWLGFALSPKGTVAGADSRLQRAVSVVGNTSRFFQRSIKGSVSGRYPVIPLLGISVRKAVAFPSLLPLCRKILRKVYMRQRVAALSNGANLAPHEISMLFAVLPVTFCKGLFNQIHRKFTFQGKKIRPGTCFYIPGLRFCFMRSALLSIFLLRQEEVLHIPQFFQVSIFHLSAFF